MSFLRTISTGRLVAVCASATALAAGGTAIALGAAGGGPVPPAKPLANAVHDAATAPETQGITADVKFTNHLIDTSGVHGQSPLLSGATGRLWFSPQRGLRLELQSDGNGQDAQLVASKAGFWAYEPSSNTVYRGAFPADRQEKAGKEQHKVPSVAQIGRGIGRARQHLVVSGATPTNVAGQPAYSVRVSPGQSGGLLGAVQLAWDAAHGLPLKIAVYARGNSNPVVELEATNVSYGAVPDSTLAIAPPAGAHTVDVSPSKGNGGAGDTRASGRHKGQKLVHGPAAVASKLPFQLSAPNTLAGRTRTGVTLLNRKGGKAALVTYGNGPGAIAVFERAAKAGKTAAPSSGRQHGKLELPTVSINGATANVLDTPLGSLVSFDRGGVTYTVLGSVHAAVAESAARGL
ncbi:MAG: hypothetical protein QOC77_2524 [Thermoleophilaceae bacterium]|nr:hypothetical protein [Thermoleophilaceae bacterium]